MSDSDAKPPAKAQDRKPRRREPGGSDVGNALRAAYHDTLKEQIPPDLLDLLGKLD